MALTSGSKILVSDVKGAVKGFSVSGKTVTFTKLDGTTGTFTTQDTNTTYSAGTGISISSNKITNTGVTSVNGKTGAVTVSTGTATAVSGVFVQRGGTATIPAGGTWAYIRTSYSNGDCTNATAGTIAGGGRVALSFTDSDDYTSSYALLAIRYA